MAKSSLKSRFSKTYVYLAAAVISLAAHAVYFLALISHKELPLSYITLK